MKNNLDKKIFTTEFHLSITALYAEIVFCILFEIFFS